MAADHPLFGDVNSSISGADAIAIKAFLQSAPVTKILSDGDSLNNLIIIVADEYKLAGNTTFPFPKNSVDGPVTFAVVCRKVIIDRQAFSLMIHDPLELPPPNKDIPNDYRCVVVAESLVVDSQRDRPFHVYLNMRADTEWCFACSFKQFNGSPDVFPWLPRIKKYERDQTLLYLNDLFEVGLRELRGNVTADVPNGPNSERIAFGDSRRISSTSMRAAIQAATTGFKLKAVKGLRQQLQISSAAEDVAEIRKGFFQLPFAEIRIGGLLGADLSTEAATLRAELAAALPEPTIREKLLELPGGRTVTANALLNFTAGTQSILPHDASIEFSGHGKAGTLNESQGVIDLDLNVLLTSSPLAKAPFALPGIRDIGPQAVTVVSATCDFGGVDGISFTDLGGNRVEVHLKINGAKGGPALARLGAPSGIPVKLRLRCGDGGNGQHEILKDQVFGLSLSRRKQLGLRIVDRKIVNNTDSDVLISWLPSNGGIAFPKDKMSVLLAGHSEVEIDRFQGAESTTDEVPSEAVEYVSQDPIGLFDEQAAGLFDNVIVFNRIPASLMFGGVDQSVEWVEVTLTSVEGRAYGPTRLSPKGAQGSEWKVPILRHGGEKLRLTGRVMTSGGEVPLKPQDIEGLSVTIDDGSY
ncbi:MAG: hypothetical protein JSS49_28835 [Planctomycetes bacterium]|nr:hypothetical protein [Planctomycetota bacterium]